MFFSAMHRYGTHFVCGVGYRGAFIGSINVRILEKSQTLAAGLSFKAQYEACSATADLKAKMSKANIDTEVMVSSWTLRRLTSCCLNKPTRLCWQRSRFMLTCFKPMVAVCCSGTRSCLTVQLSQQRGLHALSASWWQLSLCEEVQLTALAHDHPRQVLSPHL